MGLVPAVLARSPDGRVCPIRAGLGMMGLPLAGCLWDVKKLKVIGMAKKVGGGKGSSSGRGASSCNRDARGRFAPKDPGSLAPSTLKRKAAAAKYKELQTRVRPGTQRTDIGASLKYGRKTSETDVGASLKMRPSPRRRKTV